jgi:hypothetical protein
MSTQLTEPPTDTPVADAEPGWARWVAATGPSGSPPPPTGDTGTDPGGRRRPWSRRLAAGLLVLGLGITSGTVGAYAGTRLAGHPATASTATVATPTASSLASVAAAVKPSV